MVFMPLKGHQRIPRTQILHHPSVYLPAFSHKPDKVYLLRQKLKEDLGTRLVLCSRVALFARETLLHRGGYFLVKGYWRFAAGGVVFSLGNWVDYNGVTF